MASGAPTPRIDTSRPHSARVYDYLLGGKDNYLVDQELGARMPAAARDAARENRAFMHRAVAWAATEGIGQFLDIGTGIPTEPNLHQIAQGIDPTGRVVYADNDPIVLRHAEALLVSTPAGRTAYLHADAREPGALLEQAAATLDFARPVCLSLITVLHFVLDEEDPYGIVRTLTGALAPGSCLILTHGSLDRFPGGGSGAAGAASVYSGSIRSQGRTAAEIMRFFDGLDLIEPGLVPSREWRPEAPVAEDAPALALSGVARVP